VRDSSVENEAYLDRHYYRTQQRRRITRKEQKQKIKDRGQEYFILYL
jgi:hypothetical protein